MKSIAWHHGTEGANKEIEDRDISNPDAEKGDMMKSSGIPLAASVSVFAALAGTNAVIDSQEGGGGALRAVSTPQTIIRFFDGFIHALGQVVGIGSAQAASAFFCPDDYGGSFSVNSVSPEIGPVDTQLEVTFCGAQFEASAAPSLKRPGFPDVLPFSTNFISQYELRASFALSDVPTGYWNPTVFNPGQGASAMLDKGFLVWDQIGIWDAFPHRVGNRAMVRMTVLGNGFFGLDGLRLARNGSVIPGTNVEVFADEKVLADFDLTGQALGVWDVQADFAGGDQGVLSAGIRVEEPRLHIIDFSPRAGGNIGSVRVLILADYLKDGVVAKLRRGADEIVGSGTLLTRDGLVTTFNLKLAALGAWDLVLGNGHVPGDEAVLVGAFTVAAGNPAQPWIKILGVPAVRFGQLNAFSIQIGNRGNVDTLVVPVIYGLPEDVSWEIKLPNGSPPSVQYNSVRSKVKDGKRAILLPETRIPANPQPVEYELLLEVPDDDGNPLTTRHIQFGAVIEE